MSHQIMGEDVVKAIGRQAGLFCFVPDVERLLQQQEEEYQRQIRGLKRCIEGRHTHIKKEPDEYFQNGYSACKYCGLKIK